MRLRFAAAVLAGGLLPAQHPTFPIGPPAKLDVSLLAGLRARSIGPAGMSGRTAAVASVPGDPSIVWVGAATGGLWKSTDGGVQFEAVFDREDCASIGAIAIDPRTPEVVWVGTGEANLRNSASVGRGLYRSRDGGRSWQKLGLEHTEHIHRIVLHPTNPLVAFVAASGTAWGENDERGVFRTEDGGQTFEKVLFVDARTGCGDLVMDPRNPDKLFAGMWQFRRQPFTFASGGPGSGIYRSVDGGDSWQRLRPEDGIPDGELGRTGLAIAASDPRVVYALVEAKQSALLRSDDGGFHFHTVNSSSGIAERPFYFGDIRVDPQDANRIYNLHTTITVSTDGGRSFQGLVGWGEAHPDHHAMWIDPLDPARILIGNDGGVYSSQDRGHTWRFCRNLPLAQFYHVAVDDNLPYHVYGGLQDNGSWRGPADVWENGGIRNLHWDEVCFGDGFATLPDPADSMQGYAMSQGGGLIRWDLHTGERRSIRPPAPAGVELRFNWNTAIAQDPFDPRSIYYGSQFVHASHDRGENWRIVSPDLTTDNESWQRQDDSGGLSVDVTGAENYCSIISIAPSPVQRGLLWVGTDDGRVQLTQDAGRSWRSVEDRIPGLPANTWCPHLEASPHRAGTVFAVFDDHRRANWTPYVYRSDDFGSSWTSLATPELDGYCLSILQDPVREDLLFVGTEFGLWFSIDAGVHWQRFTHGIPTVSVMALAIQRRANDLVVGTHGRALYILDDITPLRLLTPAMQQQKLHLFPVPDAIEYVVKQTPASRFPGNDEFRGDTRPRGAVITLHVRADELRHPDAATERVRRATVVMPEPKPDDAKTPAAAPKDQVTIEIRDAAGKLVRTFREGVQLGLNRIVWRFETDGAPWPDRELQTPPELPPGSGGQALPGEYEVTVRFQDREQKSLMHVLPDPREPFDLAAARAKVALRQRLQDIRGQLFAATQRLARARRDVALVQQRLQLDPKPKDGAADPLQPLRDAADAVGKSLSTVEERLWGPQQRRQGIPRDTGLCSEAMQQLSAVTSQFDAPNSTEQLALDRGADKAAEITAAVDAFVSGPLAQFRTALQQGKLDLLPQDGPVGGR